MQLLPVVDQDQKFLIVHISRQIIENGVPVLDNTALVGIGKEMIVNGHTYKPIAWYNTFRIKGSPIGN